MQNLTRDAKLSRDRDGKQWWWVKGCRLQIPLCRCGLVASAKMTDNLKVTACTGCNRSDPSHSLSEVGCARRTTEAVAEQLRRRSIWHGVPAVRSETRDMQNPMGNESQNLQNAPFSFCHTMLCIDVRLSVDPSVCQTPVLCQKD